MARGRGDRGEQRSLLARASAQASNGAGLLFARLDATHTAREAQLARERGVETLTRLVERLRAGEWNDELAALLQQAEALEKTLAGA